MSKAEPGNRLLVTVTRTASGIVNTPDFMTIKPAVLAVRPGNRVEFHFEGCRVPTVMIPLEGIFVERIGTPGKENPDVIVMDVLPVPRTVQTDFPYAVYSADFYDFGRGNSPPRMVLDSKPDN